MSRRRWVSGATLGVAIRVPALLLLLLAWWDGASLRSMLPAALATAPDLVVVVDTSLSARRRGVERQAATLFEQLETLPKSTRVAIVEVAEVARISRVLDRVERVVSDLNSDTVSSSADAVAGYSTDLASGIELALGLLDPVRGGALLIVSDGHTHGPDPSDLLAAASEAGVASYWLDLRASPLTPSAWIARISAPQRLAAAGTVTVAVSLGSHGATPGTLRVQVDGKLVSETAISLPAPAPLKRQVVLTGPGEHELRIDVDVPGDPVRADDSGAALVRIPKPRAVLIVSESRSPPLAASLAAGGWPVRAATPSRLLDALEAQPAVVVLDDVAIAALPSQAVPALRDAVSRRGSGLLVLGGPRSFGAGGYRGSNLESLLPVTVVPPRPDASLAALFLLDTSGSMGRLRAEGRRIDRARQALVQVASGLEPSDLVGVTGFDVAPRPLLPLRSGQPPGHALARVLATTASGGTRLRPALVDAMDDLANAPVAQRLLFVITDAKVEGELEVADLVRRAEVDNIQIMALVIGDGPIPPALAQLAGSARGAVLRVGRTAELPQLLRRELDRRRFAPIVERIRPYPTGAQALLPNVERWPLLDGYAMTRARSDSSVFLTAPGGAPILAMRELGAGRVAALPAGLDEWASAWLAWPRFGELAGALVTGLSPSEGAPSLHAVLRSEGQTLRLSVDRLDSAGRWSLAEPSSVQLFTPGRSEPRSIALEAVAPGRFRAALAHAVPGRYSALVSAGPERVRSHHLHTPSADLDEQARQLLAPVQEEGVLRPFVAMSQLGAAASARGPLLAAAAIWYLLALTFEAWWLRASNARPGPLER